MLVVSVAPGASPVMVPVTVAPARVVGVTSSNCASGSAELVMLTGRLTAAPRRTFWKMIVSGVLSSASAGGSTVSMMVSVIVSRGALYPLALTSMGLKVSVAE